MGGQRAPLVGRAHERAQLRAALDGALAGRGNLVLIGGAAGIGKTALAENLGQAATAAGALVLTGRCYDLTDTPPYGPWLELFGAYRPEPGLPDLPAALAGSDAAGDYASQPVLFAQARGFLAAVVAQRPLLLTLDDLHWADPASLDLLRFLVRHLAAQRLLLVVTYRADEVIRGHPLYRLLPSLAHERHVTRLDLPPLSAADVALLVQARYPLPPADHARLVAALHTRSEGNPFFANELLHEFEATGVLTPAGAAWRLGDLACAGVPSLLRQVIDGRLARLGETTHSLLGLAAVIGLEAPLELWAAVAGVSVDEVLPAVDRAVAAHTLEEAPGGAAVRFAHGLIQAALYVGLAPSLRRAGHRKAAEALLAAGEPDPDAVAYHFRQAGDARAAAWLVKAGERAQRAYAWLTAADRYEAALALLDSGDATARERGWLLLRLVRMRTYAHPRQGLPLLDEAARLAAVAEDRVLAAYASFYRGLLGCMAGELRGGLVAMERGIQALDACPEDDRDWLAATARLGITADRNNYRAPLARWCAYAGHYARAGVLAERITAQHPVAVAPSQPGGSSYADAYAALAIAAASGGRVAAAREAFGQAREAYGTLGQFYQAGIVATQELLWVALPYAPDALEERCALAAAAEEDWARASGTLSGLPTRLAWFPLLVLEGRWAEARALGREAHAVGGPIFERHVLPGLAWLAAAQDDLDFAWSLIAGRLPAGPATAPGNVVFFTALGLQQVAATLAIAAEDLTAARAWLAAHDRWQAWNGTTLREADGHLGWAAYYRAAGDPARARARATRALACATAPRQPLALLAAHRLLGEWDTAAERQAAAAAHLDVALALADACAAPYERALTLLALAELRTATGDFAGARAALDDARGVLAPLAAGPALAQADALAAQLAITQTAPPSPPEPLPTARARGGPYPDRLTGREATVLRLIAAGRSNREIADELSLSVRTVERHLTNIYTKIDAHSKAAATAYAFRHQLVGDE